MTNMSVKIPYISRGGKENFRTTKNGTQYVSLSVASSTRKDETVWRYVNCYGSQADFAQKYLRKGSRIHVQGEERAYASLGQDGQPRAQVRTMTAAMPVADMLTLVRTRIMHSSRRRSSLFSRLRWRRTRAIRSRRCRIRAMCSSRRHSLSSRALLVMAIITISSMRSSRRHSLSRRSRRECRILTFPQTTCRSEASHRPGLA